MNDKQFAEFKAYLDGRFDQQWQQIDARFAAQSRELKVYVDERFDREHKYIEIRFDTVDRDIRELRAEVLDMHKKFSVLQSAVDGYVLRVEDQGQELTVMKHQMDRYARHIQLIAEKIGLELPV